MCVIIRKPPGVDRPDDDVIAMCQDANWHGAGYMYPAADGQQVRIRKGFWSADELMADYDRHVAANVPAVVHFRLATTGHISVGNCHPYPVSRGNRHPYPVSPDNRELGQAICTARYGLVHNGTLDTSSWSAGELDRFSDTRLFVRDVLAYIPDRLYADILAQCPGHWAVMGPGGTVATTGHWHGHQGCWFSNMNWARPRPQLRTKTLLADNGGLGLPPSEIDMLANDRCYDGRLHEAAVFSGFLHCGRCGLPIELEDD